MNLTQKTDTIKYSSISPKKYFQNIAKDHSGSALRIGLPSESGYFQLEGGQNEEKEFRNFALLP